MTRTWTREDGVKVTYSTYGTDAIVRLYSPHNATQQWTYEYWQAGKALNLALVFAALLELQEVYEKPTEAA